MCGIAGSYPKQNKDVVAAFANNLLHRGPDASQLVETPTGTLGHTRLAIVDVSGGHQPMQDRGNWLVFNGQIYNYRELRKRLPEPFQTDSDTEVILKLYQAYGPNSVGLLDGMFAFALMDGEDLYMARDPLGIKPLYYVSRGEQLYFASEIKALAEFSQEIKEFPPGHWWHSRFGLQRYYQLVKPQLVDRPAEKVPGAEDLALIQHTLRQAVHERLIADIQVPVGVSLSGGLDSSLVAALAREAKTVLDTFVVGTPESEDIEVSQRVAKQLGTRHHVYRYDFKEMLAALPEVIYSLESFDAPLVRSAIPNYFLAKLASDHVKVILTGEGADELFAGYEYLAPIKEPDVLQEELFAITDNLHHTNLQRADRMTMAHSIEGRVPFLDVQLVDLALSLPADWKLQNAQPEKALLRLAFDGLLEEDVLWRTKQKFSDGAGSIDMMSAYAEQTISDEAFIQECSLPGGGELKSKEELLYYRIFQEQFGEKLSPEMVGRTISIIPGEL